MPFGTELIPAGLQLIGGLGQTIFGGGRRAQHQLEQLNKNAPKYQQNSSILDFYNKALSRYDPNAYNFASYRKGQADINSNLNSGINAAQDRRSGLAAIGGLVGASNRAALGNIANAEKIQGANLGALGNAARAKLGEDRMAFKVNEQDPFERQYNLLAMKAAQGNKTQNMGLQNIFGGLSNASMLMGGNGRRRNSTTGTSIYDYSGGGDESNNNYQDWG